MLLTSVLGATSSAVLAFLWFLFTKVICPHSQLAVKIRFSLFLFAFSNLTIASQRAPQSPPHAPPDPRAAAIVAARRCSSFCPAAPPSVRILKMPAKIGVFLLVLRAAPPECKPRAAFRMMYIRPLNKRYHSESKRAISASCALLSPVPVPTTLPPIAEMDLRSLQGCCTRTRDESHMESNICHFLLPITSIIF